MSQKIVFMGSPKFSAQILTRLTEGYKVCGVVTQPDRPSGRGKVITSPPVKLLADQLHIPTIQPERLKDPGAFEQLVEWNPDVIVVAAFGQILRPKVLDLPKFGCVNVHASYLPRWRGAAPIQAAILNGDDHSGITIMKMDPGIDTGPILMQEKVEVSHDETLLSLSEKLAVVGSSLVVKALDEYLSGKLHPVDQPETGATYAPMLSKADGLLDFTQPALVIDRKVRALNDWPGTFYEFNQQPLKIRKVKVVPCEPHPGGVRGVLDKFPSISTPDAWIELLEVQPAGKNWMSGADFIRGIKNWNTNT